MGLERESWLLRGIVGGRRIEAVQRQAGEVEEMGREHSGRRHGWGYRCCGL